MPAEETAEEKKQKKQNKKSRQTHRGSRRDGMPEPVQKLILQSAASTSFFRVYHV